MEKTILEHLGIIMDGNRRWATKNGLISVEGHRAGYKKAMEVANWCREMGIRILTVFAFSTENWQRTETEVNFLMDLAYYLFSTDIKKLHRDNVRVRLIGRKEGLSEKLKTVIAAAEKLTENNTANMLNLAINYGGRQELIDAFNKILKSACRQADRPGKITEEMISGNIYTAGIPDPELIIRTSGETRLSGFLLWQSAYSELHFTEKYWPEFSKKDLKDALSSYAGRQRRFGK